MASKGGVIVVVSGEDKTGEVFNAIKKHLDETRAAAKDTSDSLGDIGKMLQSGLQMAGIGIGVQQIVSGFKQMISTTMEAAVQIGKLHQQTGISVQNLSALKYAAQASGVEFETVAKSGKKLAEAIHETDTGKLSEGFKILSITAEQVRAKGNDMYGVMALIADKFHAMPDGIEKNVAAVKLFGKSGQEMIPILNQGAEALEELRKNAPIFTDEDIEKMHKAHTALVQLQGTVQKLGIEMTVGLAPGIQAVVGWLTKLYDHDNLQAGLAAMDTWADEFVRALARAGFAAGTFNSIPNPFDNYVPADAIAKLKRLNDSEGNNGRLPQLLSRRMDLGSLSADDPGDSGRPPAPGAGGDSAAQIAADQKRADDAMRSLAEAEAKLDETRSRVHFQTMLSILEDWHKQGLVSDADYLTRKGNFQNVSYDAERTKLITERRALTDQMNTLASGDVKTGKDRIETEIKLNALQVKNLDIESQLVVLDAKRATSARQIEEAYAALMAKPIDTSGLDQSGMSASPFPAAKMPNVSLAKDYSQIDNEAEKFAHGLFDPLFNLGEKWDKQWKQIRANMLKDVGQTAESQLFGALFGDPSGRGGKGWDGSRGDSGTAGPGGHKGIMGQGGGMLSGLLGKFFGGKGAGTASNGGLGGGAGTIASAAASVAQMGKAGVAGGAGAIQIVLNNNAAPMQVDQAQMSAGDGGEGQVIQIVLKQLETNGPVAQGIMGLFNP
jgi:DNA-binding Xre family transcriptional regulator